MKRTVFIGRSLPILSFIILRSDNIRDGPEHCQRDIIQISFEQMYVNDNDDLIISIINDE